MMKELDHQSDTDDNEASCSVEKAEGDDGCSSQDDQPQPDPLCNIGCPCKSTESWLSFELSQSYEFRNGYYGLCSNT